MCVACGVPLNIAESPAGRPRARVHPALIAQGKTKQQIKDRARRRVRRGRPRRCPRSDGFDLAAYLVPIALVARRARRPRGRRAALAAQPRRRRRARRRQRPPARPLDDATRSASTTTSPATTLTDMLAQADRADTTVFAAFAVGFVSFISPCVLPLVPGYLSAVSGVIDRRDARARAHDRPGPLAGDHLLPLVHGDVRRARA